MSNRIDELQRELQASQRRNVELEDRLEASVVEAANLRDAAARLEAEARDSAAGHSAAVKALEGDKERLAAALDTTRNERDKALYEMHTAKAKLGAAQRQLGRTARDRDAAGLARAGIGD
jgi:chromosome segregation ATPase